MLQSIRDRSQSWVAGAIVSAVIAAFALWGVYSYLGMGGSSQSDNVAKVNRVPITQADLNAAYERLRQQQQMQLGADFVIDPQAELQLKKQALNQLIMQQILVQSAVKEGYRVTMPEVESALLNIPAFQVNGRFSRERFNEVLSGILYTENTFLNDLQTTMVINQVRSGLISSAFALPNDIETAVKLIGQKRDFNYLVIPAERFKNSIDVSDEQAKDYYTQHIAEFTSPEQVSLQYITLSLPQIASQLKFTNDQLTQYYQNNLSNYTTPQRWHVAHILAKVSPEASDADVAAAKAKIDDIAKRLNDGEDFAKLAKENSDDHISAEDGGVLDWFSTGMIDPSFEKAVVNLKQVGDVTQPTRTKYGFEIIKLIDIQKPEAQSFAKVKGQVEKAIAQQQAEQIFAEDNDKLSNLTYANPTSLDVAAKTLGLQVKSTDLFDHKGGKDDLTQKRKIIEAAFSNDVMQGNNSNVIELDPDTLIVVRLKQHVPASQRSFDSVKEQVVSNLKTQMAQKKIQELGQDMVQQIQSGKSKDDVAGAQELDWKSASDVGRYSNQVSAAIRSLAFRMPRPTDKQTFSVGGYQLPNGDYAVLVLNKVHDGNISDMSDNQKRIYREQIENGNGQMDYALYTHGLVDKSKVVINKPKSDTENS